MNHPTDLTSQLAFNFGHTNSLEEQFHNIYIDNVSLIMLDSEPIPTSTPEPTVEPIPTHWPPYPCLLILCQHSQLNLIIYSQVLIYQEIL